MLNPKILRSVIKEYGVVWAVNRAAYSAKLKLLRTAPFLSKYFEKKTAYPKRLDLFQLDTDGLRSAIKSLSDSDKAELIEKADRACNGVISGFSSIILKYGNPPDWQLNPLTGKRCNEHEAWFQIPDFDPERGDIKTIWEASRFSHFVTLARSYLLTDDPKYYWAFSSQLKDWLEKNPYNYGANFKCGQECSLRMVNTLIAFAVFRKTGIATDADVSMLRDLIDRCYRKVLSNFFYADKCIKNNHTISELMGMIVGAWCCNDSIRIEKAYHRLDQVIEEQFCEDGGYCQYSFNYQRLALQVLECVLSIEGQTGRTLSFESKKRIKNAARLMYQCQDASGDVPNYGSNDGALAFPVTSCGYRDFKPVINTVHALTAKTQLYSSGKHQEELLWFSNGKKLQDLDTEIFDRVSSQFSDAGLFTLRNGKSWAMIVANAYKSRPAHMDQLHLDLWIDDLNVLCDAGTFSYASEIGKQLTKNESHNTVSVPEIPQMNTHGPFLIYDWTERTMGICNETTFEGSIKSMNGYSHYRKVVQTGDFYEVTDRVDRDYIIAFHTPCNVFLSGNRALLFWKDKLMCEISSNGEMKLQEAKRSLYYLQETDIRCLTISAYAGTEIKTVIEIGKGEI